MVQCNSENFKKICQSIDVADPNKIDFRKIPVFLDKSHDGSVPGFSSSLAIIAKKSNKGHLLGKSSEEQALVRQWLDYAVTSVNYVDALHISKWILKEINLTLGQQTFIAGNFLSLADVVLYHLLYNAVSNLTFYEKEQYMHLSRWYNHLQQDSKIRGANCSLTFSRTPLY